MEALMATDKRKKEEHVTEAHPGPHGEQEITDTPVRTDHSDATRRNVAQNSSTVGNRLNPSVNGPLEDPTDDSMFNNADPQTRELLHRESKRQTKTRKHRKVA
jgi:hypothetical protein